MSKVKFNLMESCMDDCNENDIVFVDTEQYGLTQEQIMIGMGRMGGCTMKGLSLASNLGNQNPINYIEGTLRHEIPRYRGDLLESVYRNIKYINDTDFMDTLYETEECKGDFDKITKGKHTYPFWYKGK